MKKLITFAAFAFLLIPATQSFAGDTMAALTTTQGAILGFTPSNKVAMYYGNDTVSANAQYYVAAAKHEGGDRAYGTTTKTNLLVTARHDDCVGVDAAACVGETSATLFTGDTNGQDNVDGLTGWTVL